MDRRSALIIGASIILGCLVLSATHLAEVLTTPAPSGLETTRRYEILVPLKHNDGRPVDAEKITKTLAELEDQFGGWTHAPQTLKGVWKDGAKRYEDESALVYVDVEDTPNSRRWIAEWKRRLEGRFEQDSMYIVSYPVRQE
jgi:hypothetical protein